MFALIIAVSGMVGMYMLGRYHGKDAAYTEMFGPSDFADDLHFDVPPSVAVVATVDEVAPVVAPKVKKAKVAKTVTTTKAKKSSKKSK